MCCTAQSSPVCLDTAMCGLGTGVGWTALKEAHNVCCVDVVMVSTDRFSYHVRNMLGFILCQSMYSLVYFSQEYICFMLGCVLPGLQEVKRVCKNSQHDRFVHQCDIDTTISIIYFTIWCGP